MFKHVFENSVQKAIPVSEMLSSNRSSLFSLLKSLLDLVVCTSTYMFWLV